MKISTKVFDLIKFHTPLVTKFVKYNGMMPTIEGLNILYSHCTQDNMPSWEDMKSAIMVCRDFGNNALEEALKAGSLGKNIYCEAKKSSINGKDKLK